MVLEGQNTDHSLWITRVADHYTRRRDEAVTAITGNEARSKRLIAGFECDDSLLIEDRKEILDRFGEEKFYESEIRKELSQKGLKPFAILPHSEFRKLINPFPFYEFHSLNDKAEVKAAVQNFVFETTLSGESLFFNPLIGAACATFLGLFAVIPLKVEQSINFWQTIVLAACALVGGLLGFFLTVRARNKKMTNATQYLWPAKNDTDFSSLAHFWNNQIDYVQLHLPKPPKEVASQLLNFYKKGYREMYTVVHRDAIGFEINKNLIRKYEVQKKSDPLICYDTLGMTVVVGAFASTPEEDLLIERIDQQFNELLRKFNCSLN